MGFVVLLGSRHMHALVAAKSKSDEGRKIRQSPSFDEDRGWRHRIVHSWRPQGTRTQSPTWGGADRWLLDMPGESGTPATCRLCGSSAPLHRCDKEPAVGEATKRIASKHASSDALSRLRHMDISPSFSLTIRRWRFAARGGVTELAEFTVIRKQTHLAQ